MTQPNESQAAVLVWFDQHRTANEAAALAAEVGPRLAESYRKRVHELRRAGWIVSSGKRKCRETNRLAETYIRALSRPEDQPELF